MTDQAISAATLRDAAERLGVHPNTVGSWLERGVLKSLDPADVEALRARIYSDPDAAPKRLVPNPRANDGQADEPDFLLVEDREARQERAPGSPDSPAVASVPTQGDSAAPMSYVELVESMHPEDVPEPIREAANAILARLREIEQTLRHAEGTRSTPTDSWLNAYQEDVRWLVTRLRERI